MFPIMIEWAQRRSRDQLKRERIDEPMRARRSMWRARRTPRERSKAPTRVEHDVVIIHVEVVVVEFQIRKARGPIRPTAHKIFLCKQSPSRSLLASYEPRPKVKFGASRSPSTRSFGRDHGLDLL